MVYLLLLMPTVNVEDGLALDAVGLIEGPLPSALPSTFYRDAGEISRFLPMGSLVFLSIILFFVQRRKISTGAKTRI